ncbi:hypothetical protein GX50_07635 [[Emmonsia] crescens]|uniref:F-box domain-containing protein n=1 Tax=[Emmonsia] crescens TaxID=73230 RepID=A0A2B7Z9B3_9EURO|nr:hypothetical protein GX50_07635 [Emmonsia crescens]
MGTFPQEIIELIVYFADYVTCRRLLTVSRGFQSAVERSSWSGYRHLPNSDIKVFLALYRGYRVRFLRNIIVNLDFPESRDEEKALLECREALDDIRTNNEFLTRQISDLFMAIKTLEERERPKDLPKVVSLIIETPFQPNTNEQHCDHRRFHGWRVQLLNHQELPKLSSIRTLVIGEDGRKDAACRDERPLDLRVVADLVSKLPNLEVLDCQYLHERFPNYALYPVLSHFTRPWEGPWRDSRHAFAKAMTGDIFPAKLKTAKLHFGSNRDSHLGWHVDQNVTLPNLIEPLSYDPLCSALRVFSLRLTELDIHIFADSSLFWPSSGESGAAPPHWPYLKRLNVEFQPASPSGVWYFQGPDGEGRNATAYKVTHEHYPSLTESEADKEWDRNRYDEDGTLLSVSNSLFRIIPIDEHLEPFLEAFAKALCNMPLLEEACLLTTLMWRPGARIGCKDDNYATANWWSVTYAATSAVPCLTWQVIGGWRPSDELRQHFYDVARQNSRLPLNEKWIDN